LTNNEKSCPSCGTLNIKKAGYSKTGIQRYICRECGKVFSDNTKERPNISEAVELLLKGVSLSEASEKTSYSKEYLRKLMVPYYQTEEISKEQKVLILRYGYHLRVPVDYMAQYVKCSEHKCREVLQKYREEIKSTIRDAT
jgi:transposase-like protein